MEKTGDTALTKWLKLTWPAMGQKGIVYLLIRCTQNNTHSLLCGVPAPNSSSESSLRSRNQNQTERHSTKYQNCSQKCQCHERYREAVPSWRRHKRHDKAKGDLGLDPGPQPPTPVFMVKEHCWDNWWNLKEGKFEGSKTGPMILSVLNWLIWEWYCG